MQENQSQDLARTAFQLLALGTLTATSFWILSPFLLPLVWATTIAVATWPVLVCVQSWLGGRRSRAVAVLTIALLLVLVVPLYFGVSSIVENARPVADWSKSIAMLPIPQPPAWMESVPVVGSRLAAGWRQLAAAGWEDLGVRLAPVARNLAVWFVGRIGGGGLLLLNFLLTIGIVAVLYVHGEAAARNAERLARRLAGPRGENAVQLAAQAVRAVALGVVVTAILQSACAGIGLVVAGVPFATILTAASFVTSVAQVGPGPVLFPAVIWVYFTRGPVWGTVFLVWAIFCGTFDNFVKPLLIRRGADLPLLLIFSGVIGGLIAFGVIGLFIGPVVLAVAYTLLADWVSESDAVDVRGPTTVA